MHREEHQYHGDVQANPTVDTKLRYSIGDSRQRMDDYELVVSQTNRVKVRGFQANQLDHSLVNILC